MKFKNLCLVSALCVVFALAMIPPASGIEVGDKAPDFELPSTQRRQAEAQQLSRKEKRSESDLLPRLDERRSVGAILAKPGCGWDAREKQLLIDFLCASAGGPSLLHGERYGRYHTKG